VSVSLAVIALLVLLGFLGLAIAAARFQEQAQVQSRLAADKEAESGKALLAKDEADAARRKMMLTLIDMHASQGLMASERGDPAQAVLWFASAARLAKEDSERQHLNRIRAHTWARRAFTPLHGFLGSGNWVVSQAISLHPSGRYLLVPETIKNKRGAFHWRVWDVETEQPVPLPNSAAAATSAAWAPDGKHLALATATGNISLIDFPAGTEVQRVPIATSVQWLAFSPDRGLLALAGGATVRVWDCRKKAFVTGKLGHPADVYSLVFSPRGDRLATACHDGQVRVFAVAGDAAKPVFPPLPHTPWEPAFHGSRPLPPLFIDEGRRLLTVWHAALTCSDAEKGTRVWSESTTLGQATALAACSSYAAIGGGLTTDGRVQLVDLKSAKAIGPVLRHRNAVTCVAFSADSKTLLTGSLDRTLRCWAVPSGEPLFQPLVHPASIFFLALTPDGRSLITGQEGGQVRFWALPGDEPGSYRLPVDGAGSFACLSPDGRYVLAGGMTCSFCRLASSRVVDVASGLPAGPALAPGALILGTAFSPDGRQVATLSGRETKAPRLHLWDWRTGKLWALAVTLPSEPRGLDYRPDGACLAVYCAGGELVLVDPRHGSILRQWRVPPNTNPPTHYINGNGAVRFGPDGKRIFLWGTNQGLRAYDAETGRADPAFELDVVCHDVHFSADGHLVAIAAFDGTARVLSYATGQLDGAPLKHPDWVFDAQFSPDGRHLLTTCRDSMARVWDWKARRLVSPPLVHGNEVHAAAFTPDGNWVVTASLDRTARVWDWRTGMPVTPGLPLRGRGLNVAVTADSRYAVVGGFAVALEVIHLADLAEDEELDAEDLCQWAEVLSGQRVHEGGGVANLTAQEWLDRWQAFHPRHPGYGVSPARSRAKR
jgi:WD40 repeat protein